MRTVAVALLLAVTAVAQDDPVSRSWNQPVTPFRIVGNLYYVGASDITSYLITTPKGHIILDGGFVETAPMILENVRRLGFRTEDVRFLLNSHAHLDHAGGLAALKAATKATLIASHEDAPLLARGGKDDPQFFDRFPFPPVTAGRLIKDGERVELGGVAMTARITPGHTQGCTTWMMNVAEGRKTFGVAFLCSPSVPPSYKLLDNPRYPDAVEDYRRQFTILRSLSPDIFLASHGSFFGLPEKMAARANGGANPFVDRAGYRRRVAASEAYFEKRLAEEKAAVPRKIVVLRNTTVIDGTGAPSRTNVDAIITGEKIDDVVPTTSAPAIVR